MTPASSPSSSTESSSATSRSLVWFRRDLRVNDNSALYYAAEDKPESGLIGLYIATPKQWQEHSDSPHKVSFTIGCLKELSEELAKQNIPLLFEVCDDYQQVPELITKLCRRLDVDHVFFNREYEVNERIRDAKTMEALDDAGIATQMFHDRVLIPPHEIKTQEEKFYSVFTPYRKQWDQKFGDFAELIERPKKQHVCGVDASPIPDSIPGFELTEAWQEQFPAGEKAASKKLKQFADRISAYHEHRDLPALDGTSSLSAYLAAGAISPRQCVQMALADRPPAALQEEENEGARIWVSELAWRDFYTHVLIGFERVSKHQPFKLKTNQLDWRVDQTELAAWKNGKTGFPIVDAGMRQLNQSGWMHNRLRMVTAMFLTKNMLIDWRLGEAYFMEQLIDGDLAANNGGWQWSASTGTDAVPYFRIFNPFSQSKRFDPDGEFIKRMCPELEPIPPAALHDPKKLTSAIKQHGVDYPDYVVDYKASRERAIAAFKALNAD